MVGDCGCLCLVVFVCDLCRLMVVDCGFVEVVNVGLWVCGGGWVLPDG